MLGGGMLGLSGTVRALADVPQPIRHSRHTRYAAGDIREAWLFGETTRYRHFVLGDDFEAAGLAIRDASGTLHRVELEALEVFEDREARIVDLDQDGRNEVAVVVSHQHVGSLLALYGLRNGKLRRIAETPANGQANRWLNPSGIGRFLGGEERQIAIVRRPHLDGTLELWGFIDSRLSRKAAITGYSTHRIGSRHQRLFAVIPLPDRDLLALPTRDRTQIAILDFSKSIPEIARLPLEGRADGVISVTKDRSAHPAAILSIPLEGGRSSRLVFRLVT